MNQPSLRLRVFLGAACLLPFAACSDPSREETTESVASGVISNDLVISQVYGGGGNSGASYTHDFVEIFNRGTSAVSVNGWSVQYGASAENFGNDPTKIVPLPNVSVQPGRYLLIQGASGGAVGAALPTPDATLATLAMSNNNGKVALVRNSVAALGCGAAATRCNATTNTSIVDIVGYGTASDYEGTAAVAALLNTTAAVRNSAGCVETDSNVTDFTVAAPAPRNSAVTPTACATADGGTEAGVDASDASIGVDASDASVGVDASDASIATDASGVDASVGDASTGTDSSVADGGLLGTGLVISQVYGGGGNSGATLNRDYVELFNRSTQAVSLNGLSIQYGGGTRDFGSPSADGGPSADIFVLPNVTVQPGKYFLVGQNSNNLAIGAALPAVDGDGNIGFSGTSGKVALARTTSGLGCGGTADAGGGGRCPATNVVDMVGYGTPTDQEGAGPAPGLSNTTAAFRGPFGCADTDNNATDFVTALPAPRNSASPAINCANPPADGGLVTDAGRTDSGAADSGAGLDAGRPADAGIRPGDASTTRPDAAAADGSADGGTETPADTGCSCSAVGNREESGRGVLALNALLLGFGAVIARRRRR